MAKLMEGEAWLARRLGTHGVLGVFNGLTDSTERKRRMREAIKERGLQEVRITEPGEERPRTITYGAAFERLYGEPL